MPAAHKLGFILAVHPTSRGFGWALFESPLSVVDWGMAHAKQGRNEKLLRRFERLLSRYEPPVVVLEEFEGGACRRADRIQLLCRNMVHLAACRGMETSVYRKSTVQAVFASVGASTRHEIALAIAQRIEAFSHRIPSDRKPWVAEDPRQSLFDAAALALTHFAVAGSDS